jgi:hypothetical protein
MSSSSKLADTVAVAAMGGALPDCVNHTVLGINSRRYPKLMASLYPNRGAETFLVTARDDNLLPPEEARVN